MNAPVLPPLRKNPFSLAANINEIAVTLWVCASFYVTVATGGKNEPALFIPLAAGSLALVWLTYKQPVIAKVDPLLTIGVFILVFGILGSYLFNSQRYDPIFIVGNLASAAFFFMGLYTITRKIDLDFRKTVVFQCIFCTPLFPYIVATSTIVWGRMAPADLQPNYVGMMALLCFIGACSARSFLSVVVLSVIPVYTILGMESRDSMLGAGIAVMIIAWYNLQRLGWKKAAPFVIAALVGGPIVGIGLYFAGLDPIGKLSDGIESVFMLNDQYRGITTSGASGRTDLWNAAVNLWLTHPVFGVGFKGHQWMMPDHMFAHNAYLAMLADVGTVGFVGYILIVSVAIYRTFQRGNRGLSEYPQRLAILISYLIYGLLETRAFSFGNSYSVLFMLVAFDSSKMHLKPAKPLELRIGKPTTASQDPGSASGGRPVTWLRTNKPRAIDNERGIHKR